MSQENKTVEAEVKLCMDILLTDVETQSTVALVLDNVVTHVELDNRVPLYEPSSSEADYASSEFDTSVSEFGDAGCGSYNSLSRHVTPSNSHDDIRVVQSVLDSYDVLLRHDDRKTFPLSPIPDEEDATADEPDPDIDLYHPQENVEVEVGQALFSLVSVIETDLQVQTDVSATMDDMLEQVETQEQVTSVMDQLLDDVEQSVAAASLKAKPSPPVFKHKRPRTRSVDQKNNTERKSLFSDSFLSRTSTSHRPTNKQRPQRTFTWNQIKLSRARSSSNSGHQRRLSNSLPVPMQHLTSPHRRRASIESDDLPAPLGSSPLQDLFKNRRGSPSCGRKSVLLMHSMTPPLLAGRKTL